MKNVLVLCAAIALVFGLSSAVGAYTVEFNHSMNGTEFISPYVATTWDFNSTPLGSLPANWSGNARVVQGSATGSYAAPAAGATVPFVQDTSQFVTVPTNFSSAPK